MCLKHGIEQLPSFWGEQTQAISDEPWKEEFIAFALACALPWMATADPCVGTSRASGAAQPFSGGCELANSWV